METVSSNMIFWTFWSPKTELALSTKVYRKPTHTDHYFNFASIHSPHVKRGDMESLYN
jgi:hypothetical protein